MKMGLSLPVMGPAAEPDQLVALTKYAEEAGFSTVWTADRLLHPVKPRSRYPAAPDGQLPPESRRALDPLETLSFLAGATETIRLGTAVLNIPFYNPVVLGRRLATLDILSRGRLTIGFGLGWSEDEFEASGTTARGRGRRAEEFLSVLEALWGPDPVSFAGQFYRVPASLVEAKPVQKPRPPVFLAAFAPEAMGRVVRRADGWLPVGFPLPALKATWQSLQVQARESGRELRLIAGSFAQLTEQPLDDPRPILCGSREQWRADLAGLEEIGTEEVYVVARGGLDQDRQLIDTLVALR
ncbi:MAG: TIGR03619 family F420-dependent LLM class oxidoreductase [Vulcanimicrobiota bacterium]